MTDENIKNNEQLDLDDLDEASGGYIFSPGDKYEVIDERGDVVKTVYLSSRSEVGHILAARQAGAEARARGLSDDLLSWSELNDLRSKNH